MAKLPASYTSANPGVANLNTAFWAHRAVFNRVQAMFKFMILDVQKLQGALEGASETLQVKLDASYRSREDLPAITSAYCENADAVVTAFAELDARLLSEYPGMSLLIIMVSFALITHDNFR